MITLDNILIADNGTRIDYVFTASPDINKFINQKDNLFIEYLENISHVPKSILAIPFISNWLPIAWFAGFDIVVDEIDSEFYSSMKNLKDEFAKQFPDYNLKGSLKAKTLVENKCIGKKTAMLFSGGVDAYATYIRIKHKEPELVTILGADIEIEDTEQWSRFKSFLENEELLATNQKQYITTNVRNFYTYQVELLLKDIGWWGKVQHGLSLIGSIAPLGFIRGYENIYIASSYTKEIQIAWGSTPKTDETIRWCGTKVFHDGYELKRQDKVDLIADFAKTNKVPFRLRVCYSELRTDFNCSNCEKCFRTILGILLNDEDPNDYGFVVDESVYDKIFSTINHGGASKGMQYFWLELKDKADKANSFFVFKDKELEEAKLEKIKTGKLNAIIESKLKNKTGILAKGQFIIRNRFPWLRKIYRKIKYQNKILFPSTLLLNHKKIQMKYGLLTYDENRKFFNVGDNIQSLAAKQFLPQVDVYLNRERLGDYTGERVKLIMNGWFTHNIHNWVPSEDIDPVFVSFHMNNTAAPFMLSEKGISYLKQHQPIGCRDQFTADTLNEKGIEAYFTGCLTLTLDSYKVDDSERGDKVYIVDPLYNYPRPEKVFYNPKLTVKNILNGKAFQLGKKNKHLKNFISEELLKKAEFINQEPPSNTYSDEQKFQMAEDLLNKYARAKMVITSRIHCALPCLALGTPVIFVNGFDSFVDSCRFDGILELFNRIDINSQTGDFTSNFGLNGKIDANTNIKNLEKHHALANALKKTVKEALS